MTTHNCSPSGLRRRPLAAVLVVAVTAAAAAATLPAPEGYVSDFAHVLDAATVSELTATLRSLEADTTAEVAVATVASLEGESVEQYAVQLFNQWGIGQKGVNNGVLVLVAPADRRVRIEVGYGLEPILPDGLAGEIIRNQFLPRFREDNYAVGIRDGVGRIVAIVRARHIVTPEERQRLAAGDRSKDWMFVPFFGLFVAIGAMAIGLGVRAKAVAPMAFGLLFAGLPLMMALVIVPQWTWTILAPVGLLMTAAGYRLGRQSAWRGMVRTSTSSDGWIMGGGSSSGSGSSSSSGGFGGGSSGGGGASGSW